MSHAANTPRRKHREHFGQIEKLPSGRIRARFTGPDGLRHVAPRTFDAATEARGWLAAQRVAIDADTWTPPRARRAAERNVTLAAYADTWLASRVGRDGRLLRPRTIHEYRSLLRGPLAPLAGKPVASLTPALVRRWYADQVATGRITRSARAYGFLSAITRTALEDGLLTALPCTIRGASSASTGRAVVPPTAAELELILDAIAPQHRALILVAAVGGLRWGEATELRGKDVTVERDGGQVVAVRLAIARGVVQVPGQGAHVGDPKSAAGKRQVAIFGQDARDIASHLTTHSGRFPEQLLFPARDGVSHLTQSQFNHGDWARARLAGGRPDLVFHSLRHFHGTRFTVAGGTLREVMVRLGHSSPTAALRYQHATSSRDEEIAQRLARPYSA